MDDASEQAKDAQRPVGTGPGERLQAARTRMGLSLSDVAKRMHLSADIVEAIEDNHFEEITAPIFVKGYLRAYARIVSLDENDMIDRYINFYPEEDPPISSISNLAAELSISDARVKWATYIVILIIGILLAIWLWSREQVIDAPISLDAQSLNAEAFAELTDTQQYSMETGEIPASETVASETVAGEAVGDEVPEAETGLLETTQPGRAEPFRNAPVGTDKVSLVVHADTWTDIKDANAFRLVYDLLRANETMELMGEAPFSVFLGNGHGIQIRFNGKEIDVASRVRGNNTARLMIGR